MLRTTACITLLALIIIGLVSVNFGTVEAFNVQGAIVNNTTWTKASSPISLIGDVIVNSGVALTVEAGTTVNLNGYSLNVQGSLSAQGNPDDRIIFNDAAKGVTIGRESKISNCIVHGRLIMTDGSPEISDNIIEAIPPDDATNLAGNITKGYKPADNILVDERNTGIFLKGSLDNALIANNVISGGADAIKVQSDGYVTIRGNTIRENIVNGIEITSSANLIINSNYFTHNIGRAIVDQGEAYIVIENNTFEYAPSDMRNGIYNSITGIELHGNTHKPSIVGNYISGCIVGIGNGAGLIERNLLTKNSDALHLAFGMSCTVQNNTILNNSRAIAAPSSASTIIYNNIVNSFETGSIWMTNPSDVNVTYNYWGTTDIRLISRGIMTNNFGDVTFEPFLNVLNSQAPPDNMTLSIPSPTTLPTVVSTSGQTITNKPTAIGTQNPTATPNQLGTVPTMIWEWNTAEVVIILLLSVIAVLLVFVIFYLRKKS
jgi:parallel beta-helix repeat protein